MIANLYHPIRLSSKAVAGLILSGLTILTLLLLIAGAVKLKSSLVALFMLFNALLGIPIVVVFYFMANTISLYDTYAARNCRQYNYGNYQCWLYKQPYGLIWTTLIAVILYLIFDGALMAGMRRLRCLCLGVTSVSVARADVHHAHAVVVTGNPQQVVYTTGATTTYPAATVYQPAMYQPAQPYAYQQPQYTQPPYPEGQPQYQPQPNVPPNPSTPDGPPDYKP